jgi:hypothetical protein
MSLMRHIYGPAESVMVRLRNVDGTVTIVISVVQKVASYAQENIFIH